MGEDAKHLISRSEFAEMANVSPAAITKACKGSLKPALSGKRIDILNVVAQEYVANHAPGVHVVTPKTVTKPSVPLSPPNVTLDIPDDIVEILDWTLRDVYEKFGSETQFSDWLKNVSMVETINKKRLENAYKKGELISRELVFRCFIDPLNTTHKKMLSDLSKVISVRIPAMYSAGKSAGTDARELTEELEARVRKYISDYIRPMKAKMTKAIKNVQT